MGHLNFDKYFFSDFTVENYKRLIKIAQNNYIFRTFENFDPRERFIIWRHDVDASPHFVRDLAVVDKEEGVASTFFYNLHSEFYNLLERSVIDTVYEIKSLGHSIGLHFDAQYYQIKTLQELELALIKEKRIIEDFLGFQISVFSFHRTNPFVLSCQENKYGGMLNVYSKYFQHEVGYCSDSGGYWRHRRLENVLAEADDDRLQILTHPEFWTQGIMSPKEKVQRCIDDRAHRTAMWYEENLAGIKQNNIDWL